ncbi:lysophospholipid acyltransferase family protein [Aestuariimicrobium ganziense]|uniref:lysophospholipid acyltransferase family protein n=1 Tax=Aestuariimicrobium ganziense TaxID=2773677 RepID=UPI00194487A1|nr:lysophospholipid acyltransferase family protein [Aestuariimicrobium ganziense]
MTTEPRPAGRGRYTNAWHRAARSATRILFLKPFVWRLLDVKVHGLDRITNTPETFIVVGNHSSDLDAPLIFGGLPGRMSRYLTTGVAADRFFTKWWGKAYTSLLFNAFPVERGGKSKSDDSKRNSRRGLAQQLLNDGIPILLFAEGTRSRTGAMGPLRPGAASLAIARHVPIIPVAIVGAYTAWPSHQKSLPSGRPPVHVVFGHPMMPAPGEIAHQFSERIRRRIVELHDTTARAYGMKTLAEYARTVALEQSDNSRNEPRRGTTAPTPEPPKGES